MKKFVTLSVQQLLNVYCVFIDHNAKKYTNNPTKMQKKDYRSCVSIGLNNRWFMLVLQDFLHKVSQLVLNILIVTPLTGKPLERLAKSA